MKMPWDPNWHWKDHAKWPEPEEEVVVEEDIPNKPQPRVSVKLGKRELILFGEPPPGAKVTIWPTPGFIAGFALLAAIDVISTYL